MFNRRNALNDRSAEHDVAGITARICTTFENSGNISNRSFSCIVSSTNFWNCQSLIRARDENICNVSCGRYWKKCFTQFIRLWMETPCLCPSEGHKYGGRKLTKTHVIEFCYEKPVGHINIEDCSDCEISADKSLVLTCVAGFSANMRIWLNQANRSSNKIAWRTHMTLKFAQPDSHVCRTQWGICLARQKISNKFDIFLTASRGEFLTENPPHTRGNGWATCLARNFAQLFTSRVRRA